LLQATIKLQSNIYTIVYQTVARGLLVRQAALSGPQAVLEEKAFKKISEIIK
jgi:hypothetical protein